MFIVNKDHCVTTEQKLLWNIMELLKTKEAPLVLSEEKVVEPLNDLCKLCGKDHKNVGARLACARKNKAKE